MARGAWPEDVRSLASEGVGAIGEQIEASPRDRDLRTALTRLLLFVGERGQAREVMLAAERDGVASAPLRHELAKMLADTGELGRALELFRELAGSGVLEYRLDYARALMAARRPSEAVGQLQEAVERHPEDPRARETLATILLSSGRPEEARVTLDAALRLGVESAAIWNLSGVLSWQEDSDAASAIDAWRKALVLSPQMHDARLNLGMVAASVGRNDLARAELERFVAEAPPQRFAADLERARDVLRRL